MWKYLIVTCHLVTMSRFGGNTRYIFKLQGCVGAISDVLAVLFDKLKRAGYEQRQHVLSPRQVAIIVHYLGEPSGDV